MHRSSCCSSSIVCNVAASPISFLIDAVTASLLSCNLASSLRAFGVAIRYTTRLSVLELFLRIRPRSSSGRDWLTMNELFTRNTSATDLTWRPPRSCASATITRMFHCGTVKPNALAHAVWTFEIRESTDRTALTICSTSWGGGARASLEAITSTIAEQQETLGSFPPRALEVRSLDQTYQLR